MSGFKIGGLARDSDNVRIFLFVKTCRAIGINPGTESQMLAKPTFPPSWPMYRHLQYRDYCSAEFEWRFWG